MSINDVTAGKHVPREFNVIIEIPMRADPVKYEVDKASGALFVDRFMMTAMHYPANYGYVPHTVADQILQDRCGSIGGEHIRRGVCRKRCGWPVGGQGCRQQQRNPCQGERQSAIACGSHRRLPAERT